MKYYTKIDNDGFVTAFYTSDLFPSHPENTEEITKEQYEILRDNQESKAFVSGEVIDKEKPKKELTYAQKRKAEYPPIADYIDGIVKGDDAQVQAYIDACQAIKEKYPKP